MPDGIRQTGNYVKKDMVSRTLSTKAKFNNIAEIFMKEDETQNGSISDIDEESTAGDL